MQNTFEKYLRSVVEYKYSYKDTSDTDMVEEGSSGVRITDPVVEESGDGGDKIRSVLEYDKIFSEL